MDAFVVRTPRANQKDTNKDKRNTSLSGIQSPTSESRKSTSECKIPCDQTSSSNISHEGGALNKIKPDRGQRRLFDLGGVIVIEKLEEYIKKLKDPQVSTAAKV